ncbi:MAG: hypothetical protein ACP5OG_05835 [Candidatus Nanoarchaeia archaeon]
MSDKQINPEFYFYLCNGDVLKNKKELLSSLKNMNDSVFYHHVTPERNDFANWIKDVFKESALSEKIAKCASKEEIIKLLEGKKASVPSKKKEKNKAVKKIIIHAPSMSKKKVLHLIKNT